MKKKIWAAALICIVVLGMLDGCGPKEKDTDKEAAGNTETEAVEGLHATETETEAQGNLKEDTWYVSAQNGNRREYRCDKKCQCIQYGRNHGW